MPVDISLKNAVEKIKAICDESSGRSQFFPWGGSGYKASVTHYYESSTELSHAAVQPGSAEDLQKIIKVIAETRVPFAVKSGGHNSNPEFSSTKGIQIFLVRFNKITVHAEEKLVDVGAGCLFGELYRALEPHNLNIVGGSGLAGIGVAGWLLGGGYSVKTSQYGLGIDHIKSVKIVLPDGSLKEVGEESKDEYSKDLFFAIKGGGNNYGIVTEFTLKAHPQEKSYYNFTLTYGEQYRGAVRGAIVDLIGKADAKAHLTATFRSHNTLDGVKRPFEVSCVYDGSLGLDDPFKGLIAINHKIQNYGTEYPPPAGASSDAQANESAETSIFYQADALHSCADGTHELSDFSEGLLGGVLKSVLTGAMYGALQGGAEVLLKILEADATDEAQSIVPTRYAFLASAIVPFGCLAKDTIDMIFYSGQSTLTAIKVTSPTGVVTERPMPGISQFPRGRWGCVMVDEFTDDIIKIIEEEQNKAAKKLDNKEKGGRRVDIGFRPFTKSMFDDAKPSAWPHEKDKPNCPILAYFTWKGEANDDFWVGAMKTALGNLRDRIHTLRPSSKELPYFISAALAEDVTDAKVLYRDNLDKLGRLRWRYDRHKVMDLTGGFKIPIIEEEA